MSAYDVVSALQELKEEAVLPHPVRLRDMILRRKLDADAALELNREFQAYLTQFGELQKLGATILDKLSHEPSKV